MIHSCKKNRLSDFDYSSPVAYFELFAPKTENVYLAPFAGGGAHIAPYMVLTATGTVTEKCLKRIPGVGHYVIMPNHVHMILHVSATNPLEGPMWASAPTNVKIEDFVRAWKILVSKELGESIWQMSYY